MVLHSRVPRRGCMSPPVTLCQQPLAMSAYGASGDAIDGAASTYNPFRPGWREGGPNTTSGESYDPSVWAATIKTRLRQKFAGVLYGARPKYALVAAVGTKLMVKKKDVTPLPPASI